VFNIFRFREVLSDYQSNYGLPVMQTSLRSLEKSAANQFTKAVFLMFRTVLKRSLLLRITESQEMSMGYIFTVSKYRDDGRVWHVTYCEEPVVLKCSCLRMESLGLSCDHILDFDELPKCLVLPRWSKFAKYSIRGSYVNGSLYWDSQVAARYSGLVQMCKVVAEMVYEDQDEYNRVVEYLSGEIERLKLKRNNVNCDLVLVAQNSTNENVLDPQCVRTKGCRANPNGTPGRRKRTQTCSVCGVIGHNRRCCPSIRCINVGQKQTPMSTDEGILQDEDAYNTEGYNASECQVIIAGFLVF